MIGPYCFSVTTFLKNSIVGLQQKKEQLCADMTDKKKFMIHNFKDEWRQFPAVS